MLCKSLCVQDVNPVMLGKLSSARIKEHLQTDLESHTLQDHNENSTCRNVCDENFFEINDHALSFFRLKLKKVLHIT